MNHFSIKSNMKTVYMWNIAEGRMQLSWRVRGKRKDLSWIIRCEGGAFKMKFTFPCTTNKLLTPSIWRQSLRIYVLIREILKQRKPLHAAKKRLMSLRGWMVLGTEVLDAGTVGLGAWSFFVTGPLCVL